MATSGPQRIGPYEVVSELGRGSYGAVYLARRPGEELLASVKVLLKPDDARGLARFRLEASVCRGLTHPGIPRIYGEGLHNDLFPYYAMEYCPGGSLRERIRSAPLAPAEAARVMHELARVVDHAHARGVLHRDIKPENVLFETEAGGRVLLTDFGLASDPDTVRNLTLSGEVVGTPHYLAPELLQGAPPGPASDVYALGVTLYEALAGCRPCEHASMVELLRPGPRRNTPLREHVPDVPSELSRICAKAIESDPARRYPSAAALADDLEAFGVARPDARAPGRPPGWVLVSAVIGGGSLVLALGSALWVSTRPAVPAAPTPSATPAPRPPSPVPRVSPASPPTRSATSPTLRSPSLAPTSVTPTPPWPSYRAAMRRGDHYFSSGQYTDAARIFHEAAVQFPKRPISRFARAHAYLGLGKLAEASASIREGLGLVPGWPQARIDLRVFFGARLSSILGRVEAAVARAPRDRSLRFLLAYCYHFSGRRPEARPLFEALLREQPDDDASRRFAPRGR